MGVKLNPFTGKLDVVDSPSGDFSTVELNQGTEGSPSIAFDSDSNTGIYSPGADQVAISTNGTGRLFIDASGKVGVGATPSGTGQFHVINTTGNVVSQFLSQPSGSCTIYLGTTSTADSFLQYDDSGGFLRWYEGGSERLRITSDGKLGLGTSSPSAGIHVKRASSGGQAILDNTGEDYTALDYYNNGSRKAAVQWRNSINTLRIDTFDAGSAIAFRTVDTERLRIDASGNVGIGTQTPGQLLHLSGGNIQMQPSADSQNSLIIFRNAANSTTKGLIYYNHSNDSLNFTTNGTTTEAVIDSSGRLLLGTSSSSDLASVVLEGYAGGGANAPSILWMKRKENAATISPGDGLGLLRFGSSDSGFAAEISAQADTGWASTTDAPGRLVFSTTADGASSPTERLRITSDGKVGLGTSSPNSTANFVNTAGDPSILIANGSATSGLSSLGFRIATSPVGAYQAGVFANRTNSPSAGDTELYFQNTKSGSLSTSLLIDAAGNVGIGTTAPNTTIDVNGTGRFRLNGTNQLVISTEGGNPYIFSEQNGPLHFGTYSQLRATIDASGRLLVGTTSTVSVAGSNAFIQQHGNKTTCNLALVGYANNSGGPILAFGASRSTTVGTAGTIVSSGDYLGEIRFAGDDGTDINTTGASIHAQVDGTPGTDDMPGRLVFSTTADGASSPAERMRIQSDGKIRLTNGVIYASNVSRSGISLAANAWIPTDNTGTNSDNTVSVGTASVRMSVIYAATGTINTSDANLKQDIGDLDAAELSVATAIRGLIRRYRFKDAVEAKGDNARIHVGVVAQEVEQAFVDSGLDPRRYALFCEDELEDGTKRLGIRYDELLAFVIAAL